MREIETVSIEYIGYKSPETEDEIEMEILGLETAIRGAEHRITMLKQGHHLHKMMDLASQTNKAEESNEKTVTEAPKADETEQAVKA